MRVQFEFYGTLRDAVGERQFAREVPDDATVTAALRAVATDHESLAPLVFDGEGRLRPHVNVLVNGESVRARAGGATPLAADDTVGAAPAVAGGCA
ncbi:ubiquitin-like small modifier protein 1 [Halomarina ordinaria]|uniref:Ubiquitin-like small modifier protein 1 n=1 Tax=Halomarina ordinaria TaxID=3033939 RepID=A0ABD5U4Y5_9EURY|nr:ubiquitin-like small modifier protein 1 [Halomarina sp. PSRA2]